MTYYVRVSLELDIPPDADPLAAALERLRFLKMMCPEVTGYMVEEVTEESDDD